MSETLACGLPLLEDDPVSLDKKVIEDVSVGMLDRVASIDLVVKSEVRGDAYEELEETGEWVASTVEDTVAAAFVGDSMTEREKWAEKELNGDSVLNSMDVLGDRDAEYETRDDEDADEEPD